MVGLLVHGAVEVVRSASEVFALTGNLNTARYDHTTTLLPSGEVLSLAGQNLTDKLTYLASAELYTPRISAV